MAEPNHKELALDGINNARTSYVEGSLVKSQHRLIEAQIHATLALADVAEGIAVNLDWVSIELSRIRENMPG